MLQIEPNITIVSTISPVTAGTNARYMYYTCFGILYADHMYAVLWSSLLHAVLSAAQP